jgi:ubiquinone/menaquinone biosynthesis C-methylase UbiE
VGLPLLLDKFCAKQAYGIDLDRLQIARARQRLARKHAGRVDLRVADVEHLPFADVSFDALFDFGILHHLPDWQAGIAEIRRVMKPGGTFFFEEVTRAALDRWMYRGLFEYPRENRFSEAEFVQELWTHGLEFAFPVKRVLFGDIFIGAATRAVLQPGAAEPLIRP